MMYPDPYAHVQSMNSDDTQAELECMQKIKVALSKFSTGDKMDSVSIRIENLIRLTAYITYLKTRLIEIVRRSHQ